MVYFSSLDLHPVMSPSEWVFLEGEESWATFTNAQVLDNICLDRSLLPWKLYRWLAFSPEADTPLSRFFLAPSCAIQLPRQCRETKAMCPFLHTCEVCFLWRLYYVWETSDLVKIVFFINKLRKTCKQSLVLSVSLPGSSRKCFALPNNAVFQKCHLSSAVILTFLTRLARTMNSEAG